MNNPYVVSADIYLLLQKWAAQKGLTLPSQNFFAVLRGEMLAELKKIFVFVDFITEEQLKEGFDYFFRSNQFPVISLDRIYVDVPLNLELTRAVDGSGADIGLQNRAGAPPLEEQLRIIKEGLKGAEEVYIVDDVIFTGDLLLKVIEMLEKENIKTIGVFAGIGVAEGVDKIKAKDIPVACVYEYDEVIDEVCERDFYPGIPLSGRLIADSANVSAPYLKPFGLPGKWASIPAEFQTEFSLFCWRQTAKLFSEIERCSGKQVFCHDLGRLIINFPVNGTSYVDAIQEVVLDVV